MSRRAATAAVLATMMLLAGCTGVPTHSLPQTVESVGVGRPPIAAGGPTKNAPPIQIVRDFLTAGTSDPVKHSTAREYLTPAARNRWSDTTVTIIANESVGTYDSTKRSVTVTGRKVGSLDKFGVYTPTLDGVGHGGALVPSVYTIQVVDGQNRISSLNPGLLLTEQEFRLYYPQRTLYFFDNTEHHLVPDTRYSPLIESNKVSDWMVHQLVQGPRPSLTGIVNTDPLAAQSQRISVETAAVTRVQVPGSSQLAPEVRNRLAAQISVTLDRVVQDNDIVLMDGERQVVIPAVHRAQFRAADFLSALGPRKPTSAVFYLRDGRIRTQTGKVLSGPLADGSVLLDSVALARPQAIGQALAVAGVQKSDTGLERLMIGTQYGGLRAVPLPAGRLTRPAWFPGQAQVWIGDGAKLYRVTTTDGRNSQVAQVPVPSLAGGGRLVAVRPSPDGSRVALVVEGVNNRPQLYVAGVVRAGSTVQVEAATLISPSGAVVTDVAWIDPVRLYAIGYLAQSKESQVYRTIVDGASWTNDTIGTLPNSPDSITMADGATAPWVSAHGFVWELSGGQTWLSPVATNGQTPGQNPVYLG